MACPTMENRRENVNVQTVCSKLKSDGLIKVNRKIKYKFTRLKKPHFWTWRAPINVITYYGDCSSLRDDELMFCLLHEESHIVKPQNANRLVAIWLIIIASTIAFFFGLLINGIRIQPAYLLILFLPVSAPYILRIIMRKQLMKDETEADYYASLLLKEKYGIDMPSVIVERALDTVAQRVPKDGISETFFYKYWNIYPTNADRVEFVRMRVDKK